MDIYDTLFVISLFIMIAITLIRTYNLFTLASWIDFSKTIIMFILYVIFWFVAQVALLENPSVVLYTHLFQLASGLLILNGIYIFAELFMGTAHMISKPLEAHFANKKT